MTPLETDYFEFVIESADEEEPFIIDSWAIKHDGECTRIDIAMDDKTGDIIPFDKIIGAIQEGTISSRWKTSTEYIKRKLHDGEIVGRTINIGFRNKNVHADIRQGLGARTGHALVQNRNEK